MVFLGRLRRLIAKSPLFEPLSPSAKAHLLPLFHLIKTGEGEVFFRPKDSAEYLYFLVSGRVVLDIKGQKVFLRPGMCFGEESLLDQKYYLGEARSSKAVVARIRKYRFIELLKQDRKVLNEVVLEFSRSFTRKFQKDTEQASRRHKTQLTRSHKIGILGWSLTLLAPFLSYYFTDMADFTEKQQIFLSILSGATLMWGFRLIPEFVVAFFALLVYLGIGLTDPTVILSGFSSKTFIMALSVFGLAAAVLSSGVLYRLLLHILLHTPSKPRWIMMSLMALGGALTPIIPDTSSRLNLATSFLRDTYATVHLGVKGRMWTLGVANALQSVTLFGPIFLSSSVRHYVLLSLFWGQYQEQFQWLGWLKASIVTALILGIVHVVLFRVLLKGERAPEISRPLIQNQLEILGPLSLYEWVSLGGTFLCFLGMTTTHYHHIQPEIITLLVLSTLLSFNFMHQKGFNTTINWTELFYLAGLSGLLSTAQNIGLFDVFATTLKDFGALISENFEWFIMVLFVMISITRLMIPKGAVVLLYAFFFVPLSQSVGINPWVLAFLILIFGESFYFPFQSPEYCNLREFLYKLTPYKERPVLMINLFMNLVKLGAVYLSLPYWRHLGFIV